MKNFKLSNLLVLTLATTITVSLLAGCVGENNTNNPSNQTTATMVKSTNTLINNPENLPCGVDAIMTQMAQQNGYASASDFLIKQYLVMLMAHVNLAQAKVILLIAAKPCIPITDWLLQVSIFQNLPVKEI